MIDSWVDPNGPRPSMRWGSDALPDDVLWRTEFPQKRIAAEAQKTGKGTGVLAVFDHRRRDRLVAYWPIQLPPDGNDEAYQNYAMAWEEAVRRFLYPPSPPIARNTYRRGRRR